MVYLGSQVADRQSQVEQALPKTLGREVTLPTLDALGQDSGLIRFQPRLKGQSSLSVWQQT